MRCPFCTEPLLGDVNPDPIEHHNADGYCIAYECPLCGWAWPARTQMNTAAGEVVCTDLNLVADGVLP